MATTELPVVAEGRGPEGVRWVVTAGGTAEFYETFLRTIYPDGQVDEGGFAGPSLYRNNPLNTYGGTGTRGLRRVLARADPRVQRLRVQLADGEVIDLPPVARDPQNRLVFFAALLPRTAVIRGLCGLTAEGDVVP